MRPTFARTSPACARCMSFVFAGGRPSQDSGATTGGGAASTGGGGVGTSCQKSRGLEMITRENFKKRIDAMTSVACRQCIQRPAVTPAVTPTPTPAGAKKHQHNEPASKPPKSKLGRQRPFPRKKGAAFAKPGKKMSKANKKAASSHSGDSSDYSNHSMTDCPCNRASYNSRQCPFLNDTTNDYYYHHQDNKDTKVDALLRAIEQVHNDKWLPFDRDDYGNSAAFAPSTKTLDNRLNVNAQEFKYTKNVDVNLYRGGDSSSDESATKPEAPFTFPPTFYHHDLSYSRYAPAGIASDVDSLECMCTPPVESVLLRDDGRRAVVSVGHLSDDLDDLLCQACLRRRSASSRLAEHAFNSLTSVAIDLTGTDVRLSIVTDTATTESSAYFTVDYSKQISRSKKVVRRMNFVKRGLPVGLRDAPVHYYPAHVYPAPYLDAPSLILEPIVVAGPSTCDPLMCMVPAEDIHEFTRIEQPIRVWKRLQSDSSIKSLFKQKYSIGMFSVMSYNVLSDRYATRQQYTYCPTWALAWQYRKAQIIADIRKYDSDIVSLQEVETDQFYNFFTNELANMGYTGVFCPKSRSKNHGDYSKSRCDGCAIFYKIAKFEFVKQNVLEFGNIGASLLTENANMTSVRVTSKDNIGIVLVLQIKENACQSDRPKDAKKLIVANCHLHWDPELCDVKLIQTMMFVGGIENMRQSLDKNVPVIICGDFNSLPFSGPVEFLSHGNVSTGHTDFKGIKYWKEFNRLFYDEADEGTYTHDLKLDNVYQIGQMKSTNFTYDFKGVIDYIFTSNTSIVPLAVLGGIDQWFEDNKIIGCPHIHVPSDHLPLVALLAIKFP